MSRCHVAAFSALLVLGYPLVDLATWLGLPVGAATRVRFACSVLAFAVAFEPVAVGWLVRLIKFNKVHFDKVHHRNGGSNPVTVALLAMTDGRDEYLDRSAVSAVETLGEQVDELWMHDDTGDAAYRNRLATRYPRWRHIGARCRVGFGGAISNAWAILGTQSQAEWIFHLECDFTFRRPVNLAPMAAVLAGRPHLVQLALRRQAWNAEESRAGGIVESHPEAYEDRRDDTGHEWLEHRLFFTTNPSLYRRSLCSQPWPTARQSEGHFTHQLLRGGLPGVAADDIRFGFWGARDSGEWVEHIGRERVGTGY